MKSKGYNLIHVIIIVVLTSIISGLTTGVILTKSGNNIKYNGQYDENVQDFLNAYQNITKDYYEKVDKKSLINSAINGMMDYLGESYTSYLESDEASDLISQLNSKYNGIGITIKDHTVINVLEDSPAQRAGVLTGDKIISVNDINVENTSNEEIAELIKKNDKKVELGIMRDNEPLLFSLHLETLSIPSTDYYMIENTTIGYIKMSVFAENLTNEVQNAITSLEEQGMNKLIIDLRGNTGGYLEQAYTTAQLFTVKDKLIYSLKDKNKKTNYKDEDNNEESYPIVVIVDKSTASAAEVLAAALKDSYGALIVGQKTYGKGKVQHTYTLSTGGMVKYTSSKWYRPNGECIDKVGIKPDYVVDNEFKYEKTDDGRIIISDIEDKQLNKSIELLNS